MAKKKAEVAEHEQVILEPELEEALKNATDAEMCDIAGEAKVQLAVVFLHPSVRSLDYPVRVTELEPGVRLLHLLLISTLVAAHDGLFHSRQFRCEFTPESKCICFLSPFIHLSCLDFGDISYRDVCLLLNITELDATLL